MRRSISSSHPLALGISEQSNMSIRKNVPTTLPASLTVTIVTSRTVVIRIESGLNHTALFIVMIARITRFFASRRVNILTAELFPAGPAPRTPAAGANYKSAASRLKPTCKYIITRIIFQTPSVAPRTLFRIRHPY